METQTVELLRKHLETLREIEDAYKELGTDCMLDQDLLDIAQNVTVIIEAPKLERMWRDYEEYYMEVGSDSMCFADLLYNTISVVQVNLCK